MAMLKKKLLIFVSGASGWLGSMFCAYMKRHVIANIVSITKRLHPAMNFNAMFDDARDGARIVFVNFAAKTNTRWCEKPENREEVFSTNARLPMAIMQALFTKQYDAYCHAHFIQISTGCIFDGGPFNEFSEDVSPFLNYSRAKREFEESAFNYFNSRSNFAINNGVGGLTILRPRMPIHEVRNEKNLIYKVLKFDALIDDKNSMTYIDDFFAIIWKTIKLGAEHNSRIYEIYNATNPGVISPLDIWNQIWQSDKGDKGIVSSQALFEKTNIRLTNTLLDATKMLNTFGRIPDIQNRLRHIKKALQRQQGDQIK